MSNEMHSKSSEEVIEEKKIEPQKGRSRNKKAQVDNNKSESDLEIVQPILPKRTARTRKVNDNSDILSEKNETSAVDKLPESKGKKRATKKQAQNGNTTDSSEPPAKRATRLRTTSKIIDDDGLKEATSNTSITSSTSTNTNTSRVTRLRKPVAAVEKFLEGVRTATPKRNKQQSVVSSTPQITNKSKSIDLSIMPNDISVVLNADDEDTKVETRTRRGAKTTKVADNTEIETTTSSTTNSTRTNRRGAQKRAAEVQNEDVKVTSMHSTRSGRGRAASVLKEENLESSTKVKRAKISTVVDIDDNASIVDELETTAKTRVGRTRGASQKKIEMPDVEEEIKSTRTRRGGKKVNTDKEADMDVEAEIEKPKRTRANLKKVKEPESVDEDEAIVEESIKTTRAKRGNKREATVPLDESVIVQSRTRRNVRFDGNAHKSVVTTIENKEQEPAKRATRARRK